MKHSNTILHIVFGFAIVVRMEHHFLTSELTLPKEGEGDFIHQISLDSVDRIGVR